MVQTSNKFSLTLLDKDTVGLVYEYERDLNLKSCMRELKQRVLFQKLMSELWDFHCEHELPVSAPFNFHRGMYDSDDSEYDDDISYDSFGVEYLDSLPRNRNSLKKQREREQGRIYREKYEEVCRMREEEKEKERRRINGIFLAYLRKGVIKYAKTPDGYEMDIPREIELPTAIDMNDLIGLI